MSGLEWQQVVYLCVAVFGFINTVAQWDKPRDPIDGTHIVAAFVMSALMIWMVLSI